MSLSPFGGGGFYDLRSEMNRLFDEMFEGFPRVFGGQRAASSGGWVPVLDVYNRDGDMVIKAELPGVRREDVDITVENGVLTISGERKEEREEGEGSYLVRERRYGSFRRSMTLPEGVDESRIHAKFEDGVLEVVLEGAAVVRAPRRIQIEGPESAGE
ncbi:Hsp20/alpha crystallin family protein [Rubrobacter calidifluminis]|uniref:Hsp20/alpha crystallin family protein n=1 Tax=Rubrobacter calidifluminis TaxID=1392640 RepID=UPI00235FF682|nr:Hsp20/alpha crystallin family protein [Rubrobacter calidifluminis]